MLSCRTNPPTNPMTIIGGLEDLSGGVSWRPGRFCPRIRRLEQRRKNACIRISRHCGSQLEHLHKKDDLRANVVAQRCVFPSSLPPVPQARRQRISNASKAVFFTLPAFALSEKYKPEDRSACQRPISSLLKNSFSLSFRRAGRRGISPFLGFCQREVRRCARNEGSGALFQQAVSRASSTGRCNTI